MKPRQSLVLVFAWACWWVITIAHAQQSDTVVTVTSPQESNVVSRIERFDPESGCTNVTTKTKYYRHGRLVADRAERKGATDVTALRVYHDGRLVMYQVWDSKSKLAQRTFIRDGQAMVTEASSDPDGAPDLIVFYGNSEEEIVAVMKRDEHGKLEVIDDATLSEMQQGAKAGTEFMNELSREAGVKNPTK